MGTHLSIDEVALSQGELYTIVTNKKFKGKKGSLVAIVAGTKGRSGLLSISVRLIIKKEVMSKK